MAETNWNTLALVGVIAIVGVFGLAVLFFSQQGAIGQAGRPSVLTPQINQCIASCIYEGQDPSACQALCTNTGGTAFACSSQKESKNQWSCTGCVGGAACCRAGGGESSAGGGCTAPDKSKVQCTSGGCV